MRLLGDCAALDPALNREVEILLARIESGEIPTALAAGQRIFEYFNATVDAYPGTFRNAVSRLRAIKSLEKLLDREGVTLGQLGTSRGLLYMQVGHRTCPKLLE